MELAERTIKTRPAGIYYDAGDIRVDQRWDQMPKKQFSVVETMKRIETCGAWLLFKDVQRDPDYRAFLGRGWDKIKAKIGDNLKSQVLREDALIFVTSPKRIATYHIDRECSFLLQIKGTKTIHIFDRADRRFFRKKRSNVSGQSIIMRRSTNHNFKVVQLLISCALARCSYSRELPSLG